MSKHYALGLQRAFSVSDVAVRLGFECLTQWTVTSRSTAGPIGMRSDEV